MDIKETIEKLESSKEFKEWKTSHESFYLAHVFKMTDDENKRSWQVGYYSKDKDRMVTFIVDGNINVSEETEVFKEPGKAINPLDLEKVNIGSDKALENLQGCLKDKYPKTLPMKTFYILQSLPQSGTVYNATVLTHAFKAINVKINAESGDIVSHKEVSMISQVPSGSDNTS